MYVIELFLVLVVLINLGEIGFWLMILIHYDRVEIPMRFLFSLRVIQVLAIQFVIIYAYCVELKFAQREMLILRSNHISPSSC